MHYSALLGKSGHSHTHNLGDPGTGSHSSATAKLGTIDGRAPTRVLCSHLLQAVQYRRRAALENPGVGPVGGARPRPRMQRKCSDTTPLCTKSLSGHTCRRRSWWSSPPGRSGVRSTEAEVDLHGGGVCSHIFHGHHRQLPLAWPGLAWQPGCLHLGVGPPSSPAAVVRDACLAEHAYFTKEAF